MMLSHQSIRERLAIPPDGSWRRLVIDPCTDEMLQGCSVDLHLGATLKVYTGPQMDTHRDNSPWWQELPPSDAVRRPDGRSAWVVQPERFYLGVLEQYLQIPEDVCGQLGGVSTRARDGVVIHQQAGLLDPGWYGCATLEITVACPHTVLYAGQRIAQVTFTLLDQRTTRPYRGRYLGDRTPQPAILEMETRHVR
jgi:dCTP deaminase